MVLSDPDNPCAPCEPWFSRALAAIDAINAGDPRHDDAAGGAPSKQPVARELTYGRRMTDRLANFAPTASPALRLAARAQHIGRWQIPRADYPAGRAGYLKWRAALKELHAELVRRVLAAAGCPAEVVARAAVLVRKERLKQDGKAQVLEDVACLVFLEHYFPAFAARHAEDKIIAILRKTWRKMSPRGQAAAGTLVLPEAAAALLAHALDRQTP
jgi:hypothetical protein